MGKNRPYTVVMRMIPTVLTYYSDAGVYVGPLRKAETLAEVRDHVVLLWGKVFDDAANALNNCTEADWPELKWYIRNGTRIEPRTKKYAARVMRATEAWGAIVMPRRLIHAGIVADKFVVPWGCALIRLLEMGE